MKNLLKRILSGAIYIALIVAAILLLDNSPVMYLLVFSLLIVLAIGEMITVIGGGADAAEALAACVATSNNALQGK